VEDLVTAQLDHSVPDDPRVVPIPRTIDAVASALGGEQRMAFYREVGQAEEGEELNAALHGWWMEAMFGTRPGREQRLQEARSGQDLAELPGGDE
jgi:hypothetical protein